MEMAAHVTGLREEMPAEGRGATAVRAVLSALAEDDDGLAELRNLRSALLATDNIEAALGHMSTKRSLVNVVLARYEPVCLDTQDTVARRLFGARTANRVSRWTRSRGGRAASLLCWIALGIVVPAVMFRWLDPAFGLAVWALNFAVTTLNLSARFLFPLLLLSLRSFDFWYLCFNLAFIAWGLFRIVDDKATGLMAALVMCTLGPIALLGDCLARRSRLLMLGYLVCLAITIVGISGVFFRLFPGIREVTFRLFEDTVSVSATVYSSGGTFAVFVASFIYCSLRYPDQLVLLTGMRCVKMRSAAAREICKVYSQQDRLVASAGYSMRDCAVAPVLQSLRVLSDATDLALQQAGGDAAAARQLVLGVLDELCERVSRGTMALQGDALKRWSELGRGEDKLERVLLPAFLPIVVDSRRTVANALVGARFGDLCFRACRSSLYIGLTVVVLPANYVTFLALFSAREPAAPLIVVACAVETVALVLHILQVLLLNTELLSKIVLRSFDIFWTLVNFYLVGVMGFFLFKDDVRGVMWLVAHVHISTYFWQDAAPVSRRGRRINAIALAGYALSQCFAVFAMWTHIFDAADYQMVIFDVPLSAKSWCVAGQINVAILATRFALRALADKRNLVFSLGLICILLPESEARELKAVSMAARVFDTPSLPSLFSGKVKAKPSDG
jgi:hypothetical protein